MKQNLIKMFGVIPLLLTPQPVWGEVAQKFASPPLSCQPVGRVLNNGAIGLRAGSVVCKGTQVVPRHQLGVNILCYRDGSILTFQGEARDMDHCQPQPLTIRQCLGATTHRCIRYKGGGVQTVQFLRPLGGRLLSIRPKLSWQEIEGIDQYAVSIQGRGVDVYQQTPIQYLNYPVNAPPLIPGETYRLAVVAYRKGEPITSDQIAVTVLSRPEAQVIQARLNLVQHLGLERLDQTLDQELILNQAGLVSDGLLLLDNAPADARLSTGFQQRLADRLMQAGDFNGAEKSYQRAASLAIQPDKRSFLEQRLSELRQLIASFRLE